MITGLISRVLDRGSVAFLVTLAALIALSRHVGQDPPARQPEPRSATPAH